MDGMITTLVLPREGIGARRTTRSGLGPAIVLLVAAAHIAGIAALALLVRPARLAPPPPEAGLQILFAALPQAATLTDIAASPLAVSPPEAPHLTPPKPMTVAAEVAVTPRPVHRKTPPPPRPAPPSAAASAAAPAADAPSAAGRTTSPEPEPASLAGWEAHIRQAVQDAAIYPAAARLQRRQGRAQVQFDYEQGAVLRATLVQSSQVASLDRAALAAVTHAAMPKPPAEIGARTRTLLVWVQFGLTANE